ncbi:MAG: sodium-dependent transporter [Gemmataceae bacterium]|nr:sodium-dependent transporter [Gemmataceae bacterium]MCI0739092.1 sodium-dependent transporter [Gemmataceae bacterium]
MAKERWASRMGLVLAMAGNAVGLGNFLRFPAQAARNGGGAFLIPYLVALLVVGLPLIWVEWGMGRYGGQQGHHSAPGIFQSMGKSRLWKYLGVLGLWSCLVIASYYLYVETWCFAYAAHSYMGGFEVEAPGDFFNRLTGSVTNEVFAVSPWGMGLFAGCILLNVFILSKGLAKGIEIVSKIGMPLLIAFAAVLAVRGMFIEYNPADTSVVKASPLEGLNFLWQPRLDSLADPSVWLAAAGQIFFTLSIGMGTIHCYASYLRDQDDVVLTGASAGWTNEFCEVILGGTILLPISVAYLGLNQVVDMTAGGSGFGLGFLTMPTLFNNWGGFAPFAGFLWFGLLFFAAITSSLAMGQPIMAFLQSEFRMSREKSALAFGLMLLVLAVPVAIFHDSTFNADFDFWAGSFALVVFALFETILFAWVFGMKRGWTEINKGAEMRVPSFFYFIIKYVTPVFLLVILVGYIFQPEGKVREFDPVTQREREIDRGYRPFIDALLSGETPPEWRWSGSGMIGRLLHRDLSEPGPKALPEEKKFYENVKMVRTFDRLILVGAFLFLVALVWLAWQRRARAEGDVYDQ